MNVFELFASISIKTDDYQNQLNNASQKTSSFGDKLKTGLKTAGKAGAVAIGAITTAASTMSAALIKNTSDLASYGDNIDKMSQKLGISAEAYQEWDAIMQHSGASIESMQSGMKTLASAVETGNEAFSQLGLNMDDLSGMSQEDLFGATITALQNVEDTTQRTYLASKLLGRGGTELGALLNTSAEDVEKMRQRVHELGGVMSDEAVKAAASYQDSLQDMQTAFSGITRGLTSEFLPSITTVMDGITEIFAGNGENGIALVSQGISGFIDNMQNVIPRIMEIGGSIVSSLGRAITDNLPVIIDAGVEILTKISDGIIQALPTLISTVLPKLINGAVELVGALATGIGQALPDLIPVAVEAITTIVSGLVENIPMLINAALELVKGLALGIVKAIPVLVDALPEIITAIYDTLLSSIPEIIDAGVELLTALVSDLPTIIEKIVQAIPKIVIGVTSAIAKNIPKIVQAGFKLLVALITEWPKAELTIIKALPSLIKAIYDSIVGYAKNMTQAGANLIKGLWEGIKNVKDWILGKIKNFVGGIVDKVKEFFGISSPSKVFAEIGGYLAEGLGVGFEDEYQSTEKGILKALDNTIDGVEDKIDELQKISDSYNAALDYSALMLNAKNEDEFMTFAAKRNAKIAGENLNAAGYDTNEELYRKWLSGAQTQTVDFASSALGRSTAGIINSASNGGSINLNLQVDFKLPDGRVVAEQYLQDFIRVANWNGTPIVNDLI